ncbi:Restriction endonuclease Mrr [Chromobacterium violaceum]|uniref:restriction endonuclease n=1 Tax=Chromobacterium violaceum TaxID=536 RepID=UPI003CF50C34
MLFVKRSGLRVLSAAPRLPWHTLMSLAALSWLAGRHYLFPLSPRAVVSDIVSGFSLLLQYGVPAALAACAGYSFWRRFPARARGGDAPSMKMLAEVSWQDFEALVGDMFRRQGYRVVPRSGHGPDGGVDLELFLGEERYLVQCKRWNTQKVGVAVVRELYGVMQAGRVSGGFVVCSGEFTADARAFAAGKGIVLLHGKAVLSSLLEQAAQQAGEGAGSCPSCGCAVSQR